ncbi:MAG: CocE/NonD family hydrolase [Proteobacteria bacterium]|nr:CocE/NonD family hydrolase [Pseudomonadota bacterium]
MTSAHRQDQAFRLMLDRKIPMRDGVKLSADIYLPNRAAGTGETRYPTLLLRTIYHSKDPRYVGWAVGFVKAGYAVVLEDCRGRHDSDGVWDPYICEIPDGYDTHEWIARQGWSNGEIGTFGVSYPGFTQTCPAPGGSRHLKALVPIASQQDNYGHHRCDGTIAWSNTVFFANMIGRTMQTEALNQLDMPAIWNRLPLHSTWDDIGDCPYFRDVVAHEAYGEFWQRYSLRHRYQSVEVPAYFMTGWYDSLLNETLKVFRGWRTKARSAEARQLTRIIVGPWSHQVAPWGRPQPGFKLGPGGEFEDAVFGPEAQLDIIEEHLRWYDARLRGARTGIDEEPPVRLFVMGENKWHFESEWPLARTRWTEFYLGAGGAPGDADGRSQHGSLSLEPPAGGEAPDRFRYDPNDPVPTWGGAYQMKDLGGPRDRRTLEKRSDILLYTSPPLDHDIEVVGPVTASIWAASSAADTDFAASLVDVHPDGKAIILTDGICRARFRQAATPWTPADLHHGKAPYEALYDASFTPSPLQPNTACEFKIDMWATANLFKKGHRIRLEITSSNFPRTDRNLNTGGRVGFETVGHIAEQTIYHDAERPSRLVLPVIPR